MSKFKYYDYLVHYNHNHDPRNGRFARSSGSSHNIVNSSTGAISGSKEDRREKRSVADRIFEPGSKGRPSSAEKIGQASIEGINTTKRLVARKKHSKKKDYSNLSNSELQSRINRLRMEQQYAALSEPGLSRGKQRALDVLDITGDVMAIGVSAAVIGAQVYKIKRG